MAFDFPSSPTNGQEYTSGGVTFVFNGDGWITKGGSDFVKKSGDTMTGNLSISKVASRIYLEHTSASSHGIITRNNAKARWGLYPGDGVPESGSNAGSDFALTRHADDGNSLGDALKISRATGLMTLAADPTAALGAATKQYVDTKSASATDPTKVLKAGDTMTGPLSISVGAAVNAHLNLNKSDVAAASDIYGALNGKVHWYLRLGAGGAANPFQILAADDAGTITSTPLSIARATGNATFAGVTTTMNALSLGSVAVAAPNDVSRHLALYSNSFGFSITSGTLNIVSAGTAHPFTAGGATITGTLTVTANAQVNGTLTANNTVKAGVALQTASWGGDVNQGLIYLNGQGNSYLHFSGSALNCTHPINGNNGRLWGASDGTPLWLSGGQMSGQITTASSAQAISYGGGLGTIEVRGSGAAGMSFHRPGAYAANFGLETDNTWRVGGWSMGGVSYMIHHDGNSPNSGSYIKFPSGVMIQWGYAGSTGANMWVYFPTAFPSGAVVSVQVTPWNAALQDSQSLSFHVQQWQNNGFYLQPRYNNNGGQTGLASQGYSYMAVGW